MIMASTLRGLKEYFEHYKEHQGLDIPEVVVLQILYPGPELGVENPLETTDRRREGYEREHNRLQLTDGTCRVHLNFGKEQETLKLLYEPLQMMDYDPEHLDGAYFSIMNFRFKWHWIAEIKEVVLSLETNDFRLVDAGLGQNKPRKTHYLTRIVSKRRYEIMKRDAIAKATPAEKESIGLDIQLTEIVGVQSLGGVLADECRVEDDDAGAKTPTFDKVEILPQNSGIKSLDTNVVTQSESKPPVAADQVLKKVQVAEVQSQIAPPPSEKENIEQIRSTAEMRRPPKITRAKKLKPGEEFNKIRVERQDSMDSGMLDDELGDIADELEKEMIKVKLNQQRVEPIKRGTTRTALENEFEQPQVLGWSFAAFQQDHSN
jgi:hypothetical protein